jgi:hypothetical protein
LRLSPSLAALLIGFACGGATTKSARAASLPDDDTKALPCRPTIACTADLVSPGLFELETGMLYRKIDGTARQWTFPFLAKLTLAKWVQLQIGSNGYTTAHDGPTARYFDNLSAGVKLHLVDQSSVVPSLSLSAAISVPTVDGVGYARADDAIALAYVTKDFGPIHADLNVGVTAFRIDGAPIAQEMVALALSANLPAPFAVMAESYYYSDAAPLAARDAGFLFALTHSPKPWLVFDFGGDVGYFPSTRAYSAFVGMTIVPVRLWKE